MVGQAEDRHSDSKNEIRRKRVMSPMQIQNLARNIPKAWESSSLVQWSAIQAQWGGTFTPLLLRCCCQGSLQELCPHSSAGWQFCPLKLRPVMVRAVLIISELPLESLFLVSAEAANQHDGRQFYEAIVYSRYWCFLHNKLPCFSE